MQCPLLFYVAAKGTERALSGHHRGHLPERGQSEGDAVFVGPKTFGIMAETQNFELFGVRLQPKTQENETQKTRNSAAFQYVVAVLAILPRLRLPKVDGTVFSLFVCVRVFAAHFVIIVCFSFLFAIVIYMFCVLCLLSLPLRTQYPLLLDLCLHEHDIFS